MVLKCGVFSLTMNATSFRALSFSNVIFFAWRSVFCDLLWLLVWISALGLLFSLFSSLLAKLVAGFCEPLLVLLDAAGFPWRSRLRALLVEAEALRISN